MKSDAQQTTQKWKQLENKKIICAAIKGLSFNPPSEPNKKNVAVINATKKKGIEKTKIHPKQSLIFSTVSQTSAWKFFKAKRRA